jgi:hypothetical protein
MNGNGVGNRKTLRAVANGLARRPAYLLLFGLGIIGGSVAGTVGVLGDSYYQIFAIGSMFIFLIVSATAGMKIEVSIQAASANLIPDEGARQEFGHGPNSIRLSGAWQLHWKKEDGHEHDNIAIVVNGPVVFGSAFDDENVRTYWLLGRITDDGDLSATLWGEDGQGPIGCVFLSKESRELFSGTWKGLGKDGEKGSCDVLLMRRES